MTNLNSSVFRSEITSSPGFAGLEAAINTSPTLVNQLNRLPAGTVGLTPTGMSGTYATGALGSANVGVRIDPGAFSSQTSTPEGTLQLAAKIGHEMGHVVTDGGFPPTASTMAEAVTTGLHAEGVALVNEYIVANELGAPMTGGASLAIEGSMLAAVNAGADAAGISAAMAHAAAQVAGSQTPSTAPQLTYSQYYQAGFAVGKAGLDPNQVNWQNVTSESLVVAPDGYGGWVASGSVDYNSGGSSSPRSVLTNEISGYGDGYSGSGTNWSNWGSGGYGSGYTGGGGGGNSCVATSSALPGGLMAGDICVGDTIQLAHQTTLEASSGLVTYSKRVPARGVRVTTESGASLVCSESAPIPTPEGLVLAPELLGKQVPVRRDKDECNPEVGWERVVAVESVGAIQVQHISINDRCFWAGERPGAYILHHNKYVPDWDLRSPGAESMSFGDGGRSSIDSDVVALVDAMSTFAPASTGSTNVHRTPEHVVLATDGRALG